MKVRIGVAVGALPLDRFGGVLDALDGLGFDSVWLPETFQRGGVDPLVGLAFAAARVPRLKLGTHLVAPGRNPYVLARELAQLDELSGGRLLLTLVAGLAEPAERQAQGMPTGDRTTWFDEHLPAMRDWWAGKEVDGLVLDARPRQDPLEVWLGGRAQKALVRAGQLSDGWLAGRMTLEEATAAKVVIDDAAAAAGRSISAEHFGTNLGYRAGPAAAARADRQLGRRRVLEARRAPGRAAGRLGRRAADVGAGAGPADVTTEADLAALAAAAQGASPQLVWAVVLDGRIALHGGSTATVFRIASMTKSFTAATVLALRDRGELRLDDEIEVLADQRPTADSPPVTIRDVLSMSSGLTSDDPWADRHLDMDPAELERLVRSGVLHAFPTGTAYEYSNLGYALLGGPLAAHDRPAARAARAHPHDVDAAGSRRLGSSATARRRRSATAPSPGWAACGRTSTISPRG